MQLSRFFTLAEATKSDTAERLGIDNTPPADVIETMKETCEAILEPVRFKFNRPVVIRSFYRSPALNAAIGSVPHSQHVTGQAVDFEVPGIPNADVAAYVRDHLIFDQCILEFYKPGIPDSGWVHVSFRGNGECRSECLTVNSSGTFKGLIA